MLYCFLQATMKGRQGTLLGSAQLSESVLDIHSLGKMWGILRERVYQKQT